MQILNTVIVTGYAKAPQGTSMYEMYKHAGIVLEVDLTEHKIVNAEFTFITELTQNFSGSCLLVTALQMELNLLLNVFKIIILLHLNRRLS